MTNRNEGVFSELFGDAGEASSFAAPTVAALSTPSGRGGVAMIRVSGPRAANIAGRVFHPANGCELEEMEANRATFGRFTLRGELFDEGMATLYRAPRSFTGEDTAELCCHGGILVTSMALEALYEAGAEPAGPGEFTRRAFLNGKISLTQAEAVGLLIEAESIAAVRLSAAGAGGALSRKLTAIASDIRLLLASIYAYIDYPDEDMTDITRSEMLARVGGLRTELARLADSYLAGRAVSGGVDCAIVGKPNAGKSSLLNLLYGGKRAIVSPTAGTTRDVIEARVAAGDVMLNLMDTAGMRETSDEIEREGVELARQALERSELVLAVFDRSMPLDDNDVELIERLRRCEGKQIIAVLNKSDLAQGMDITPYAGMFAAVLELSALDEASARPLIAEIERIYRVADADFAGGEILTRARQHRAVTSALESAGRAAEALLTGHTQDIAALDLEQALAQIEECDSRRVSTSVVDEIFARFCVGK